MLEVATYDPPPAAPGLLGGLGHDHDDVEDVSYRQFQHRMAPGEAALRASGEWLHPHPWLNVLLPEASAEHVVGAALAGLTAADLGNSGLVILYPIRTDRLRTPLARVPDSDLVWLFALLRTGSADDPAAVTALIEANRTIYDHAITHGGFAYPVNTLPMSPADWRAHFGPRWSQLLAAKAEYDPHAILTPGHGIIGS